MERVGEQGEESCEFGRLIESMEMTSFSKERRLRRGDECSVRVCGRDLGQSERNSFEFGRLKQGMKMVGFSKGTMKR